MIAGHVVAVERSFKVSGRAGVRLKSNAVFAHSHHVAPQTKGCRGRCGPLRARRRLRVAVRALPRVVWLRFFFVVCVALTYKEGGGDQWRCPKDSSLNFMDRVTCRRCGEKRPEQARPVVLGGEGGRAFVFRCDSCHLSLICARGIHSATGVAMFVWCEQLLRSRLLPFVSTAPAKSVRASARMRGYRALFLCALCLCVLLAVNLCGNCVGLPIDDDEDIVVVALHLTIAPLQGRK